MENPQNPKEKKPWDETLRTLIYALLLAVVVRSFMFEPFHIPSGSMKGTLLVGDYIFVSKFSYGYSRYSFPFGFKFFEGRTAGMGRPKRGDVVVFREPSDPRIDFIKRVIGLPGDTVQLKEGIVYVNGKALPREPAGQFTDDENPRRVKSIKALRETLPEGKVITILKERNFGDADDTPLYEVPPGHYFMMGDNRDNSRDSRFMNDVGYVPEENLVGRAEMIFFSSDGSGVWYNPISWGASLRFGRFFKLID